MTMLHRYFSRMFRFRGKNALCRATRLHRHEPLITSALFTEAGAPSTEGFNINGPSVIRIPAWLKKSGDVAHPDANFYMYFASHVGQYIRMAWAKELAGPWTLYGTGRQIESGQRGVLDLGAEASLCIGNGLTIAGHAASPDVHVDEDQKQIVLYFHGPVFHEKKRLGQCTLVATSENGLNFNPPDRAGESSRGIRPVVLGSSYFRVFRCRGRTYAVASRAQLYKAPGTVGESCWQVPDSFHHDTMLWEPRRDPLVMPPLVEKSGKEMLIRHAGVHVQGSRLNLFYSRIGDQPECVMHSQIDITSENWNDWSAISPASSVLVPEYQWEGTDLPLKPSESGWGIGVRELRDPYVFEDAGKLFLFYCGRGEEAIGMAELSYR